MRGLSVAQRASLLRLAGASAAALAIVVASGCSDPSGPGSSSDDSVRAVPLDPTGAEAAPDPPDRNDPWVLLERHVRAMESRNAFEYAGQLAVPGDHGPNDPGFRFFPVPTDFFPWMTDPWWDRTEEVGMIGHMFDPGFTGGAPPAQSVDVQYNVLASLQTVDSAGVPVTQVTVDMSITVLVGPASGWRADARLILDLGEDTQGRLRIRRIQEVFAFATGARVPATWGSVKELYR
jgi:hypothetical protein